MYSTLGPGPSSSPVSSSCPLATKTDGLFKLANLGLGTQSSSSSSSSSSDWLVWGMERDINGGGRLSGGGSSSSSSSSDSVSFLGSGDSSLPSGSDPGSVSSCVITISGSWIGILYFLAWKSWRTVCDLSSWITVEFTSVSSENCDYWAENNAPNDIIQVTVK